MNVQRLKFAWARGARIQCLSGYSWDSWREGSTFSDNRLDLTHTDVLQFRIHPDDEHLQYGPVSTLLRSEALSFAPTDIVWMYDAIDTTMALTRLLYPDMEKRYPGTYEEKIMFILFVVELLADEGL